MSIWNWSDRYTPKVAEKFQLTLGEGQTPCLRSKRIGPALGFENLYFKLETFNPSGSYKDRFAALAISQMNQRGQQTCLATSSGNTGAALAAYCAAAGIRCRIAVVETAPLAKLQQMLAYGAEIQKVKRFGLDARVTQQVFQRLRDQAAKPGCELQISAYRWSPFGMQGVESIAYELDERFAGTSIDHVFCPAGGGGLTLAVARGFTKAGRKTAVHCVQPQGNDTIASPLREGKTHAVDVNCETTISGLQVPNVIDGDPVISACRQSGGTGYTVSDDDVFRIQQQLMYQEGLFCEPAGAVALAGAICSLKVGEVAPRSTVVCLVTGSAFKDAASVERIIRDHECALVDLDALFVEN